MVKWYMCRSSESSVTVTSVTLKKVRPAWLDMRTASGTQPKSKVSCRRGQFLIMYFTVKADRFGIKYIRLNLLQLIFITDAQRNKNDQTVVG